MKFKTNAKCGGCTSAILKAIDSLAPASAWEFDLASPDKTLTYVGDAPAPDASSVMSAIEKAGFKASVLSAKMPSGNYSADPANERWDDRTERLLGFDAMERLRDASVLIVGAGGVGGYAAEMLVRSGIGKMTVIDADNVAESNINRQLIALRSNVGRSKAIMYAERFHDINPEAVIDALQMYVGEDEVDEILDGDFDYVLDCIDTVGPKVALLSRCLRRRVPVVSSMGAGGRIDPTKVCYMDLWQTRDDGLARAVRQRLRKAGVRSPLTTVCSMEPAGKHSLLEVEETNKRTSYGTLASIPALFGIFMANHAIRAIARV